MVQFRPMPAFTAIATAARLRTGKAPGKPRHTGHVFMFGGSPNCVEQEQKSLEFVRSCAWHSRPITASYFGFIQVMTVAYCARVEGSTESEGVRRMRSRSATRSLRRIRVCPAGLGTALRWIRQRRTNSGTDDRAHAFPQDRGWSCS